MERFIAIDNVCAWPNLTLLPDGTIVAVIFNQPSHGKMEGDVECWASTDGGALWELRGVVAPHEPRANRMNVSAGLAADGTLVALASGWSLFEYLEALKEGAVLDRDHILPCWACLSTDQGRTWTHTTDVAVPEGCDFMIPFGDIICLPDGSLASSCYCQGQDKEIANAHIVFSRDAGRSWGDAVPIGIGDYNETDLLRLREDRWLAAARTGRDAHLELFVSEDEGRSWRRQGPLTLPRQHPAHLCLLGDGRVLLTYGVRNQNYYGVAVRLSEDEGNTWGAPRRLVDLEDATDGGYPSSVQLADGTVVTAYYANRILSHRRYHMGVVRWRLEE